MQETILIRNKLKKNLKMKALQDKHYRFAIRFTTIKAKESNVFNLMCNNGIISQNKFNIVFFLIKFSVSRFSL